MAAATSIAPDHAPALLHGSAHPPPRRPSMLRSLRDAARPEVRSLRVTLLVVLICIVNVVDLILTLMFVTSVGMIEANPIARQVMHLDSPWALVVWKLALTSLTAGILLAFRRHRLAEVGAWCGVLILLALTIRWKTFLYGVQELASEYYLLQQSQHPTFVMMGEAADQ